VGHEFCLPSLTSILAGRQSNEGPITGTPTKLEPTTLGYIKENESLDTSCASPAPPVPRGFPRNRVSNSIQVHCTSTPTNAMRSPLSQEVKLRESSACLPSPTVSADSGNELKNGSEPSPLVLNPLGAGDTCSGILLAKYVETRVLISTTNYVPDCNHENWRLPCSLNLNAH
jgi:hypothetical protein